MKLIKMNRLIMVLLLFTLLLGQSSLAFAAGKPGGGTTTYIPPSITQGDGLNLSVEEGKTINFTLNAVGTNYTSFAWSNTTTTNANITKSSTSTVNGSSQITFNYQNTKPVTSDTFTVRVTDVKKKNTFDTIKINVTILKPQDLQPPVNVVVPSISGTFYVDELLTANPGTWNDSSLPLTYNYQWMVDDAVVSNTATYTPSADMVGRSVTLSVQAVDNAENASEWATSSPYAIIEKPIITTFDYVVLGDSIPNGVSYEYNTSGGIIPSYTDKLYDYFTSSYDVVNYTDYSVSGYNADEVYTQLNNPEVQDSIRNAEYISLCIGANDIMDAAKRKSMYLFLIYKVDYIDFYDIVWETADYGRLNFETYYPLIIEKIKQLNPNAELAISNIYNPYNQNDSHSYTNMTNNVLINDKLDSYLWNLEPGKLGVNSIINNFSTIFDYTVIDIYSYFETYFGNSKGDVTGFYGLSTFGFDYQDPHPDNNGQQKIYELHLNALPQTE